ncbi:MAG: DUF1778 domain-containing protein [Pyrinomonadaceae bacterium MAG19_C2-C3]|nr:DUF1778 domain-containing protein [Pyrinomonadaceae bacterium MAG19_C2-C3]
MAKVIEKRPPVTHKGTRFSIRASAAQKKVIAQAARIKETTMSEFVLEQAVLAAQQTLADQSQFTLPKKQWEAFRAALDAPPVSVPALGRLLTQPGVFDDRR